MRCIYKHVRIHILVIVLSIGILGVSKIVFAAPSISSISGSINPGNSISVTGTGFGVKNPAEPVLWAPFDTSIDPSPLGRIKAWDQSDQYPRCVQYVSTGGRSGGGVRTLDTCARTDTAELFIRTGSLGYYFNTLGQKNYLFRQRRMGYTNDVNLKSIEFMEFNNYTNGNNIVFNHTTRQWISQNIPNDSYCYMNNSPAENQWATEEMVQQTSQTANADGMIRWYANGVLIGESPSCEIAFRANPGTNMDTIKPIFHGDYNISAGSMSTTPEWWDSVYVDNTWSRVMLGDASTFSTSTHREIQIPTTWSDTSVTITANQGSFTSGQPAYLYIVDANGETNPTGYPVTIGSGGSTTTYTVTPSAGSNGTISPNTPQTVNSGSATTFIVTPNSGYNASIGGTCGGNLSGTTYTTNAIAADCTVVASFAVSGDTTPPTSPTSLAANAMGETSITVSWDPSVDDVGVVRYDIERCPGLSCSSFTQVGTAQNSPYTDSGLTASTGYSYHVRAVDAAGNTSGWSNVVGATTDAAAPSDETIIDNTDTAFVSSSGTWTSSIAYPGYYGSDYFYSSTTAGEWFQWTASSLVPGAYEVYARWPAVTGRPTDVNYQITHASGTDTVGPIDQEVNGSQWNLLGTYNFDTTGTVRVIGTATGWEGTAADAVRFLKVTSSTPTSCSTVTPTNFTDPTFTGYGAPYDVFASNTPLISTTCTASDPHTINTTFGITGDTTRIVYTKGYYYDPGINDWTSFTGTCTGALNGEWCQGSVSASVTNANISTASATDPAYVVGFTCSVQGGQWKCGCRDTSCSNFYWQVQGAGM